MFLGVHSTTWSDYLCEEMFLGVYSTTWSDYLCEEMSLGVYSTTWNDYLYEEMFLVYILQLEGITYVKKFSWAYFYEVTSGCRMYTQEHFFI
jgi:hypothetical protein